MNYNPDFKKFSLYEDESQSIVATGGTIVINYDDIELSEEELKAAILEGKKRKWFHERNKEYWDAQEDFNVKPKYVKEVKVKVGTVKIDRTIPKIHIDD